MDAPTERSVFGTLFLRFCGGVAERKREYSLVFIVSNAHHTFWEKVGSVMILDTFRAPVGQPFDLFYVLLGSVFEVVLFTTLEGNRVTASISDKQRQTARAGVWGPKNNYLHDQPQDKERPRTGSQDPGTPGTC